MVVLEKKYGRFGGHCRGRRFGNFKQQQNCDDAGSADTQVVTESNNEEVLVNDTKKEEIPIAEKSVEKEEEPMKDLLDQLETMGFVDRISNANLLRKYQGDVSAVVHEHLAVLLQ